MPNDTHEQDIIQRDKPASRLPEYQFQAYKLDLLLNVNDDDIEDALFEQLRYEVELYRTFCQCNTEKDFVTCITQVIKAMNYSEYSFVCLYTTENLKGQLAIIPKILFTSYDEEVNQRSGIMFQAAVDSIYHRHLSLVYHCIAGAHSYSQLGAMAKERYVLVASAGMDIHYLAISGFPTRSCQIQLHTQQTPDPPALKAGAKINPVDVLANAIEVVGQEMFPKLFQAARDEAALKMDRRPLRLLTTLASQDVTLRDAASILKLSGDTINKHMAKAKSILGTKTLPATIWMAVKYGLIDTND